MFNQYILEAKYLDKIGRVKKKTIVGVFKDLESIEPVKEKLISEEKDYIGLTTNNGKDADEMTALERKLENLS